MTIKKVVEVEKQEEDNTTLIFHIIYYDIKNQFPL
jgi:hypothetical protein